MSDSIPCPHYFLLKIKSFIIERNINFLCDLGSGYGKILYFFGNINNYKIDGIELDKEIFNFSKQLESEKIKIINQNILDFDLSNSQYDLLIINDPLKTNEDLNRLIQNIKKQYKNKYIVFINIDQNKIITIKKNLNIIQNYKISKNKNLLFCEIS